MIVEERRSLHAAYSPFGSGLRQQRSDDRRPAGAQHTSRQVIPEPAPASPLGGEEPLQGRTIQSIRRPTRHARTNRLRERSAVRASTWPQRSPAPMEGQVPGVTRKQPESKCRNFYKDVQLRSGTAAL